MFLKINNKNIDHIIKTVAPTLRPKWNVEYEKQTITGKDLMCSGLPKLGFNASQVVEFDVPIFTLVSHESEMKRIYKSKGLSELDKYVSQYKRNIAEEQIMRQCDFINSMNSESK